MRSEADTKAGPVGIPMDIVQAIAAADCRVTLREVDSQGWRLALAGLDYIPVAYCPASIDYQLAYQRGQCGAWWDLSLVLRLDERPCGVWPISFSIGAGKAAISSHGMPVLPPLFTREVSPKSRKVLVKGCLNLWDELRRVGNVERRESAESFTDQVQAGVSEWQRQSMRQGARALVQHELFVSLVMDLDQIKGRFRKSYRPLIASGLKMWRVGAMTEEDPRLWSDFRELHLKAAGRVTRCEQTWQLLHQAIVDGEAFLIYLLDGGQRMIGGGLFTVSRDEGVYSIAAYDRSLFSKPLGHVVQVRAIEEMKKRGIRWYKIGRRPYPADSPSPTAKELSIGEFKDGFATHTFPQYVLSYGSVVAESN